MFAGNTLLRRAALVAGVALLLFLVLGFSNRMAEYTRLTAQLELDSARMTELSATRAYLQDEITYATSEAAVEEWAREEARLAQSGDFPVIPLPPPGTTPQAPAAAIATAQPMSNWDTWLKWLFYDGP